MHHLTISGELGSGKSSVARRVAAESGRRVVSGGDVHRSFAEGLGISTGELNRRAEHEPEIDAKIDAEWRRLASSSSPLVFDARLAWHFVPDSVSVHLVVESKVAAERLFSRESSAVEKYRNECDAALGAQERQGSERRRFLEKYGIDIWRLSNYDLVIDTTHASIDQVVEVVQRHAVVRATPDTELMISPWRVVPTVHVSAALADPRHEKACNKSSLGYSRPFFFVLDGHEAVSAALWANEPLVSASLAAEGNDIIERAGGITADQYLRYEPKRSWLYDWEDAHGFRFLDYPDLEAWRENAAANR